MIEKLKALGDAAKTAVIYLLSPIIAVLMIIWYLWNKKTAAEGELSAAKAGGKLEELGKEEKVDAVAASDALTEYQRIRDAYLHPGDSSVRPGASGKGQADK